MPYNIFSGSGAAMKGLTEGAGFVNDWTDRAREQRAGYRAAPRIASGDYAGTAGEYASEGMAEWTRLGMLEYAAAAIRASLVSDEC